MSLKELKELVKSGEVITVRGVDIKVNEFTLSDIPEISKLAANIKFNTENVAKMILDNIETFYKMVSISTGEDVADIKKYLSIDEFTEVAAKVFEVNMNLFLHKVTPKIKEMSEKLKPNPGEK